MQINGSIDTPDSRTSDKQLVFHLAATFARANPALQDG
jgi:hypothetical protein